VDIHEIADSMSSVEDSNSGLLTPKCLSSSSSAFLVRRGRNLHKQGHVRHWC